MASRVLVRKLSLLASQCAPVSMSSHFFILAAISDPCSVSIIQQCRMLEATTKIDSLRLYLWGNHEFSRLAYMYIPFMEVLWYFELTIR